MSIPPPTVFVLDDDDEVRVALTRLLRARGYAVRSYASAETFLAEVDPETSGCLLLDIGMPGLSGLELQLMLAGAAVRRAVVFLTGTADICASVHAMRAGAVDFLIKPVDEVSLVAAIERALRVDSRERLECASHRAAESRAAALTPRERQVLERVVRGRLNKQIAAELGTGEKTVKVHRARMMSKMGVRSVAELVMLASRIGASRPPGTRSSSPSPL
jgi:FixJ family two-component response regulator